MPGETKKVTLKSKITEKESIKCGIIMPISAIGDYTEDHWAEVETIIKEVTLSLNFDANIVSDRDEIGIIQKTIIENLYNCPIVIADVSGKNPNVMFELGMRLAFDKPTIIIKDNQTNYSFDTGVIEHLTYPKDLKYSTILKFKEDLARKLTATYEASTTNPDYSTFLKNFGTFKTAKLDEVEVGAQEYLIDSVRAIQGDISSLKSLMAEKPVFNPRRRILENKNNIVRQFINDYVGTRHLQSILDLNNPEEFNKALRYLVEFKTIRELFDGRSDVEAYLKKILEDSKI